MPTPSRIILALALALGAFTSAVPLHAQDFLNSAGAAATAGPGQGAAHVNAALVSNQAAITPGQSFLIALTLGHPKHHHTYWKNPGDAGSLTGITWTKDGGAKFGAWRFPAPRLFVQGDILNYVFEGKTTILIPVTAPASLKAGDTLELTGKAEWLECDDSSCIPGGADLSIKIPVSDKAVAAEADLFAAAEKAMPKPAPEGSVSIEIQGKDKVALHISAAALDGRTAISGKFFPDSEGVPTTFTKTKPTAGKDGGITFVFSDAAKVVEAKKLTGVIVFDSGDALSVNTTPATTAPATALTTAKSAAAEETYGLPALLALAFGGGILLNIMPCVFPVLGLKIYGFVNKAHADRKKVVGHALAFAGGIIVSFWILAGVIIALKSGAITFFGESGGNIGWGFLLQLPGFVAGIAVLFLVMGLSMAGVFEFGTGVQNAAGSVEDKGGYAGSFLSGALATLVATPCSGPGIAPALGAAFAAPAGVAFAIFTAMAVGLALPFVVLACSPSLLKKLPRPGAWMESFKQGMAFLLFGTLAYFVWILGAQIEGLPFLIVLFALVGISVGCWIYGRWCVPSKETRTRRVGAIFAAMFFVGGCVAIAKSLPDRESAETTAKTGITWAEWTPETEAKHLAAGETVYVDFTARWCATCQVNKRVFHESAVEKAFAAGKVVALKADWTNKNAAITKELKKYGRSAIPFNVVLRKDSAAKSLPSVLTVDAVLDALGDK